VHDSVGVADRFADHLCIYASYRPDRGIVTHRCDRRKLPGSDASLWPWKRAQAMAATIQPRS
jgi:hypothetical protein